MSSCDSIDDLNSGWDRTFLDLSSKVAEPVCSAYEFLRYRLVAPLDPKKFDNGPDPVREVAYRALVCLGAVAFLPLLGVTAFCLGVGSKILRAIGFALQKEGFTHVRGRAPEKSLDPQNPQIKIATWNIGGIAGGMSFDRVGVPHWRTRLEGIVQKIKAEDPDVVLLQEIYDTALAEALIEKLKNEYAHFFVHLGPNLIGSIGGGMVLSKYPVHRFADEPFKNNPWKISRSFATLEIKAKPGDAQPCARIIGTHLHDGYEQQDKEKRACQVAQIIDSVAKQTLAIPTVIAGDLNMERDHEGQYLASLMHHAYQGAEPTCTNELVRQWNGKPGCDWEETIDYLSLFKRTVCQGKELPVTDEGVRLEDCRLIEAFDSTYNTQTALSDHHGLTAVLKMI